MSLTIGLDVEFVPSSSDVEFDPNEEKLGKILAQYLSEINTTDYIEDLWDHIGTSGFDLHVTAHDSIPQLSEGEITILRNQAIIMGALNLILRGLFDLSESNNILVDLQIRALKKRGNETKELLDKLGVYEIGV